MRANARADVPDDVAIAYLVPQYLANSSSQYESFILQSEVSSFLHLAIEGRLGQGYGYPRLCHMTHVSCCSSEWA
jgi:hypothetical protein